jgi:hypothetical protein
MNEGSHPLYQNENAAIPPLPGSGLDTKPEAFLSFSRVAAARRIPDLWIAISN